LEIISCYGVGVDAIDLEGAARRSIAVTTTPGVLVDDVADQALALLLAVSRNIVGADRHVREGKWAISELPLTRRVNGKKAGILGLGDIGKALAVRLAAMRMSISYCNRKAADVPYRFWNRTPEKTRPAVEAGARRVDTVQDAAKDSGAVIVMLQDGAAVTEQLTSNGLLETCAPGTLVIDMSSISPVVARDHAAIVQAAGLRYLDAPVSGGTLGAAAGSLTIMAGGEPEVFAAAEPILRALGTPHLLGAPGRGQLCKLANLTLVAVTLGAVAEALTLIKAGGGDPAAARKVLLGGFSQSRILEVQGERMIRRDFAPGGRIKSQIKDLDTILATAARFGVSMPLTSRTRELFVALRETHGETLDHSAIILQIEKLMQPAAATGGATSAMS
jgi:2-hydroxy-3-oxopropionate reductase